MATDGMDPSLIQDFLTEAGELIEQLDGDLVALEEVDESQRADLLNQIFRALHTIKGAASFLNFTPLTSFAHVAEDALNRMRKGEIAVSAQIMDVLLQSVDVLRGMLSEIAEGEPITPGPAELANALKAIGDGEAVDAGAADAEAAPQAAALADAQPAANAESVAIEAESVAAAATAESGAVPQRRSLELAPEKQDLLQFMATDLKESAEQIEDCLDQLFDPQHAEAAIKHLGDLAQSLIQTAEFFELESLHKLFRALQSLGGRVAELSEELIGEATVRIRAISLLAREQAEALEEQTALIWPVDVFLERMASLSENRPTPSDVLGRHENDPQRVMVLDGLLPAEVESQAGPADDASGDAAGAAPETGEQGGEGPRKAASGAKPGAEQTVRVEVGRLEALLNLVGQLVLSKNRFMALGRRLRDHQLPPEMVEEINGSTGELDRLTSELQVGVMRTRMQPLAKLFDRYPRVIRDIARNTGKQIHLEIAGKGTEVDKSVLELLADPLVHILRNSADHGIEMPEARRAAGKREQGNILLAAEHQGSHVRVEIRDDGKGLDRDVLASKAVERGLATTEQVAAMPDEQVFQFIFAPGFSTAAEVTDLSGRGVGMDVVRSNIAKLNGSISLGSTKGEGTTIEILIPLTVAIMPAMVVGVGEHLYSVPLTAILEIVRPDDRMMSSVMGQPVMRLRDRVLPLIDMRERLGEVGAMPAQRFAVVVGVGQERAGLIVDRLIGQQEVVIKPLDDEYTSGGPFSGATIREDGDVSLILDIIQLIRQAQVSERAAAA